MERARGTYFANQRLRFAYIKPLVTKEQIIRYSEHRLIYAFRCKYRSKRDEWIEFARFIASDYPDDFEDLLTKVRQRYE